MDWSSQTDFPTEVVGFDGINSLEEQVILCFSHSNGLGSKIPPGWLPDGRKYMGAGENGASEKIDASRVVLGKTNHRRVEIRRDSMPRVGIAFQPALWVERRLLKKEAPWSASMDACQNIVTPHDFLNIHKRPTAFCAKEEALNYVPL